MRRRPSFARNWRVGTKRNRSYWKTSSKQRESFRKHSKIGTIAKRSYLKKKSTNLNRRSWAKVPAKMRNPNLQNLEK